MSPQENSRFAIYGADSFGVETMVFAKEFLQWVSPRADLVFVDDDATLAGREMNGIPIIGFDQMVDERRDVCIAIADSRLRESLTGKCAAHEIKTWEMRASTHLRGDGCENVGEGGIFASHSMLTANVTIGRNFHLNIYGYVAHDCVIGDFVTCAPRVSINGRCVIEDHAYIGTGAVLRQGTHEKPLTIGEGAVVGMGAVVTKDVPAGVTVVGNPARPLDHGNRLIPKPYVPVNCQTMASTRPIR